MLLGIPVQQFISCFYTVPLQFGFFGDGEEQTKAEQLEEGLLPSAKTDEGEDQDKQEDAPADATAEPERFAINGDDDKQD